MRRAGDLLAVSAGGSGARSRAARAGPPPRPILLVLRALGLGDLLTAVPALRALAAAHPAHRRVLAAPRALAPLVALIGPDPGRVPGRAERAVHGLVDLPAWVGGGEGPATAAAAALPARASLAVNLHGRGPESHRLLLATGARRLLAYAHPDVPESAGGPAWEEDEHEVERWCRLPRAAGIAAEPAGLDLPAPGGDVPAPLATGQRVAADPGRRAPDCLPASLAAGRSAAPTILHPGAASPARRWPPERWAAVARAERAAGRPVLITGSTTETPLARHVARGARLPRRAVVAGRTDLRGLAGLVAGARRVVCGDTGVAHLATALRVPSVVLFGPVSPARWGPPPDRSWHRALWAGRHGDPHARAPDPGLLEITAQDVLAALADLPAAAPPRDAAVPA